MGLAPICFCRYETHFIITQTLDSAHSLYWNAFEFMFYNSIILVTFSDKSGTVPTTPTREDAFVVQRGRTVPTLSSVARTGSPAPNLELDKHLKNN